MSVLLVDDEPAVTEPLASALGREGYVADVRHTGAEALQAFGDNGYGMVVLDLGLPDMDGIALCRRLRELDPAVPLLLLTARGEEVDVVVGLDAGADDYVIKPFRVAELFARMRALLRRSEGEAEITVGRLRIDTAGRRALLDGDELVLSTKEFDLLALLARNAGVVVARDQLLRDVWNAAGSDQSRTLDTHVSSVRRKLATTAAGIRLEAVRGVGFRLLED